MKDLEIRGAGNLLGGEQSGHIAGVGFDLYVRLVGEAVADFRGDGDRRAGRDQDRAAGRRAPAARLRAGGAAAPRGVQEARDRRADEAALDEIEAELRRPLRRAARAGAEPARGGAAAHRGPRRPASATSRVQGNVRAVRPGRAAREPAAAAQRLYPGTLVKEALGTILVPVPMTARVGGKPLRDVDVLAWARQLIQAVLLDDIAAASSASSGAARSAMGAP